MNQGVKTVIESSADVDVERGQRDEKLPIQGAAGTQSPGRERGVGGNSRRERNTSQTGLTYLDSDEEMAWGIRKTTVQTQVAE